MTIYLDCNATTPMEPEVIEIVRYYMEVEFANPGSRTHEAGLRAKKAVEKAREQVAAVVNAKPDEVIFTSGATEANNLAILGLEEEGRRTGRMHIITSQLEHKAVLEPIQALAARGFRVTYLAPTSGGWVSPTDFRAALRDDTLLASIMHVNNETGIVQPIADIANSLDDHPAFLHVDAAQGFGKLPGLSLARIDLLSSSAHKLYGPKGVGALITRRRGWHPPPLKPLMHGGGQERGLRPGTLPTPIIAGFGLAAEMAVRHEQSRKAACNEIRRRVLAGISDFAQVVGDQDRRCHWTTLLMIPGIDSEGLLLLLRGIASVSNGSACTSSRYTTSHVLTSMGINELHASTAIRLSWSHFPLDLKALDAFLATLRGSIRNAANPHIQHPTGPAH